MDDILSPEFLENLQIPIDLFVTKKRGAVDGGLRFVNAAGDLVFRIQRRGSPTESTRRQLVVVVPSGDPLVCINRESKGCWQVFKGDVNIEENLIFRVERKLYRVTEAEFKILPSEDGEVSTDFKMKGSPFHRACTIYKDDSIVAQTSLMYKLGIQKVIVPRHRFRLTIFPGFEDHALIVALIGIYFRGRKLWI